MAKTAAERKAKQRAKKKAHLEAMKAEQVCFDIFHGTRSALDRIKPEGMGDSEFITLMIHAIDNPGDSHTAKLCGVTVTKINTDNVTVTESEND